MRVDDVDVVICSSSGWAHGIPTNAPKLVYCHNPPRWLYQPEDYVQSQPLLVRGALTALRPTLTAWDQRAAASATRYPRQLAGRAGARAADVRHRRCGAGSPGAHPGRGSARGGAGSRAGFFLVVGRSRGYKNVEVVCEAFRRLPEHRLVVVGGLPTGRGPQHNVLGATDVSDEQLRWYYANCRAVIAVSHEDFGLTPLEGTPSGRPALVLRAGGFLDTLVEGVTGHFIDTLDVQLCSRRQTSLTAGLDGRAMLGTPTATASAPSRPSCAGPSRPPCGKAPSLAVSARTGRTHALACALTTTWSAHFSVEKHRRSAG
jgi:hypothetical protein